MQHYRPLQPPVIRHQKPSEFGFHYREYSPSSLLASYVSCYWTISSCHSALSDNRIIPDGCVDVIIHLTADGTPNHAFAAGLMTSFATTQVSRQSSFLGIRLYVEHAHIFLGAPVSQLKDQVWLDHIWGREAGYFLEQLAGCSGIVEQIAQIEAKLMAILSSNEPLLNPVLHAGMQYIYDSRGMLSIRELAEQLCYSERNLRRVFISELGASRKELSSIIRFQYLLRKLQQGERAALAHIAAQYGYYDQSHFNKHFKRYYGLAPSQVFG